MKLESFGEHAAKTACPGKIWFSFYDRFRATRINFEWSLQSLVNFSSLVGRMDFILHIMIVLNGVNNFWSCWIIQKSKKCIFEWSKEPKKRFLVIFCSLICWMDLTLHNVIVLNVFQHSTTLPDHEGSFKCHKNAFLNDPKSQKRGFWPFSGLWSVGSTWYCIMW